MRVLAAIGGTLLITVASARADDDPGRFRIVARVGGQHSDGGIRLCMPPAGHGATPECSPPASWPTTDIEPERLTLEQMDQRQKAARR